MKTLMLNTCILAGALVLSATVLAVDKPMTAKEQDAMKAMREFADPGPSHKVLQDLEGEWKFTSKAWSSADSPASEATGTSKFKTIFGGRYVQHDLKGIAMGAPLEALGLTGFNKLTGKYETNWIDNMSTAMVRGEGSYDAGTKTLKEDGQYSDPANPSKISRYRGEWKFLNKNTVVYTMYGPPVGGGAEIKQMEMTFKRVQ